jgi:hypothetical protein
MEDNRLDVLDRLAAADPAPAASKLDQARAERALAAILTQPRAQPVPRWRRPRLVLAAAAVLIVGMAAPAVASDRVRSFIGLEAHPHPVLEESTLLVSAPVAEGTVARLWLSPSTTGGECLFETYGPPGDVEHAPDMSGGGMCTERPISWEGIPLTFTGVHTGSGGKPHGATERVPPAVSGRVHPKLGAARVEVRWSGGSKALVLENEYFIGAVEELHEPPAERLPFFLVAYDADGQEVARLKLPRLG